MKIKKFIEKRKSVLIIHGFGVTSGDCFYTWLKSELETKGFQVDLPSLPHPDNPIVEEQVDFILNNYDSQWNQIICHSFGGCVGMKLLERLDYSIDSLVLISCFSDNNFYPNDPDIEALEASTTWQFDFEEIKSKANKIFVLRPDKESFITPEQSQDLADNLGTEVIEFTSVENHAVAKEEPEILKFVLDKKVNNFQDFVNELHRIKTGESSSGRTRLFDTIHDDPSSAKSYSASLLLKKDLAEREFDDLKKMTGAPDWIIKDVLKDPDSARSGRFDKMREPQSKGGAKFDYKNLAVCCFKCNQEKKNMNYHNWLGHLEYKKKKSQN